MLFGKVIQVVHELIWGSNLVKRSSFFKNKTALITGGIGALGLRLMKAFQNHGANVIIVDIKSTNDAIPYIREYESNKVIYIQSDLSQEVERIKLFQSIKNSNDNIDILINNAAFVGTSSISGWNEPFMLQSLESWRRALELNLTAPFHLAQLFKDDLSTSGEGSILNIGSIYGVVAPTIDLYKGLNMNNPAAYGCSKAGLIYLTKWLAVNLAPNVRVNAISPGGLARGQNPIFIERYTSNTPLGRMGEEDDIVGGAMFLASSDAKWITGQNLVIDGGWTIK
jgi:NAD(P)-dependent dehydrogenase (short-subunit alcohol dehydrogenase family)